MTEAVAPYVGTAGWSISRGASQHFPGEGTHLQRYARVLRCAEINSSFHRPHAARTYERWALATPPEFRFSVKVPRAITHDARLRRAREPFDRFLEETAGLGSRRGPLLVQLPPSLEFEPRVTARFFDLVRARYEGALVCEARHATWLSAPAERLLAEAHVARVAADPPRVSGAEHPGGWRGLAYYRWHGSPRTYWSRYDVDAICQLAITLRARQAHGDVWCIFDNTASGAALENAWELRVQLSAGSGPPADAASGSAMNL